jgi:uncharacterized membrane protein
MGWFEFLLLVHILGALIGFGPTYAFAVLGPLSGKLEGPQSLGVLKGILAIERKLVIPIATLVQPLTGVLLIFASHRNENFLDNEWLWISILLYIATYYTAVFVQTPALEKLVHMAESGEAGSEEFLATVKKTQKFGPLITLALTAIVFLMITKPGAPDSFF